MNQETWCIIFENTVTGHKEYREFPKMCQFSSRKKLNKELQKRKYLAEYIVSEIKLLKLLKIKHETARLLGSLVYSQ